jgi:hypothetical protein
MIGKTEKQCEIVSAKNDNCNTHPTYTIRAALHWIILPQAKPGLD